MKTVTQALIWRQWRIVRIPAISTLVVASALIVLDVLLHRLSLITEDDMILGSFAFAMGTVLFALFTLVQGSDMNNLTPSFPANLYSLPIRSSRLAFVELAGRTIGFLLVSVSILLVLAAGSWLISNQAESVAAPTAIATKLVSAAQVLIVIVAVYSAVQAVCWCPFGVQALILAMVGVSLISPLRTGFIALMQSLAALSTASHFALAAASIAISYLVAWAAVRHARGGTASLAFVDLTLPAFTARKPFRSPTSAQSWMEWRAFGSMVPGVALLLTIVLAVCIYEVFSTLKTPATSNIPVGAGFAVTTMTTLFAPGSVAVAAFIAGTLLFFRDIQERNKLMSFSFVRPMPTRDLASARLRTGLVSIVCSIVVLSLLLCGLHLMYGGGQSSALLRSAFDVKESDPFITAIALHVALFVIAAWILLWLGPPIILAMFVVVYPIAIAAQLALMAGISDRSVALAAGTVSYLIASGLILACAASALRSWRKGIMSARGVTLAVVVWAFAGAFIHYYAQVENVRPSQGDPIHPLLATLFEESIIWGIAFLPALPMLSVPLTFHRLRHR